jgi:hypothetical protein
MSSDFFKIIVGLSKNGLVETMKASPSYPKIELGDEYFPNMRLYVWGGICSI